MRVAVVQFDPCLRDSAANLEALRAGVRAADADLVVFPECALQGYSYDSRDEALLIAQMVPGPATAALAEDCAQARCVAIFGLLERDGDRLFNTAAIVGPDGLIGRYRKMHLPFLGVDRFADPGDLGFPVFETPVARIGVLICFDLSFPEAARCLKLAGAQVLCVPTNWPLAAEVSCVHSPPVRAQENHIHVVTADRVGEEGGFRFRGESRVVDCSGRVVAVAGAGVEVLRATIDPAAADRNRVVYVPGKYELDRVGGRRPEHYGPVSS
ncbi:MAG: carbon-nitrogen hydrolase family protein [Planctomycetes bacterium]|nr:carbon-nitrogen hydrolase family protein [Planctomycetota bacterium]MCC7170596.1 carbon-nitrogen hydrolase family protein [Planctomycetota bacterium]